MLLYRTAKNKSKQLLRQPSNGIQIHKDIHLEFSAQSLDTTNNIDIHKGGMPHNPVNAEPTSFFIIT